MSRAKTTDIEFLSSGLAGYPEIMIALDAFRNEVFNRCKKGVIEQLDSLATAFGLSLAKADVRTYRGKYFDGPTDECSISVSLCSKQMKHKISFYVGLFWEIPADKPSILSVYSGFWAKRAAIDLIEQAVRRHKTLFNEMEFFKGDGYYCYQELNHDNQCDWEKYLQKTITAWSNFLKNTNGIQKYMK